MVNADYRSGVWCEIDVSGWGGEAVDLGGRSDRRCVSVEKYLCLASLFGGMEEA